MHLSEFKAWFQGFTEEMDGPPNKKQWAKIQKQVEEITADYTPSRIFIDRYIRPYRPYWDQPYYERWTTNTTNDLKTLRASDWHSAGQAEFKSLSAQ